MAIIQWCDSYSVSQTEIDNQHRKLVDMIAELQRSLGNGLNNPQVGVTLRELVHYIKFHFRDEEEIMRQVGYPELEAHIKLHEHLTEQVVAILNNLKHGESLTAHNLISFLKSWLIDHIIQEDKKIGLYIHVHTNVVRADT